MQKKIISSIVEHHDNNLRSVYFVCVLNNYEMEDEIVFYISHA